MDDGIAVFPFFFRNNRGVSYMALKASVIVVSANRRTHSPQLWASPFIIFSVEDKEVRAPGFELTTTWLRGNSTNH